jgi:hypothetical protein
MRKETLEEAAEKYVEINVAKNVAKLMYKEHFVDGAKWQQERSYSEEEVLNIIQLFNDDFNMIHDTVPKWFEQFKKKYEKRR